MRAPEAAEAASPDPSRGWVSRLLRLSAWAATPPVSVAQTLQHVTDSAITLGVICLILDEILRLHLKR